MICAIFYSTPGKIVAQMLQFLASQKKYVHKEMEETLLENK